MLNNDRVPPPFWFDDFVHLFGVYHMQKLPFVYTELVQVLGLSVYKPQALPG